MAEDELALERLRAEFHQQTAKTAWRDLQVHYARGAVVLVGPELDLVEVAVQLQCDNKAQFEQWIASNQVSGISDARGQQLFAEDPTLWTVVSPPWVLVQEHRTHAG